MASGLDILIASLADFVTRVSRCAQDSRAVEIDGLVAGVTPATPTRSVFNSVVYRDPGAVADNRPRLQELYDAAGVRAWTVWVRPQDGALAHALAEAGHVLDAAPEGMIAELADLPESSAGVDIDRLPTVHGPLIGELNDIAYGYEAPAFRGALAAAPPDALRMYAASLDGRPASCLSISDHDGDAHVSCVATAPHAQRRGLAGALLAHALYEARDRGCKTGSLVATRAGRPVYERLGFRSVGPVEMWEHRRPG